MKRLSKLLLVFLLGFVLTTKVQASNLSNKLNVSNSLGDAVKFDISYDSGNDVTNVLTTLTINDDSLATILAQKPGVGGNLGTFYVAVIPQPFIGMTQHKQVNYYYTKDADFQTTVKPDLNNKILSKTIDTSGDPSTWVYGVAAQYYDTATSSWKIASGAGTGTISIGQNLADTLGLASVNDLVYGENYRLFMYENYDWYIEYQEVADVTNTEYVKVSYKLKFPVTARINGTGVYYPNLKQAIASGSNDIIINSDMTLTEDLNIPSGVSITVADGYKLEIPEGIYLNNNGTLSGIVVNYNPIADAEEGEKNPNTSDNIILYVALATIGLSVVVITTKSLIKNN